MVLWEKRLTVCSICPLTLSHSFFNLPPGRNRFNGETRCAVIAVFLNGPGKTQARFKTRV